DGRLHKEKSDDDVANHESRVTNHQELRREYVMDSQSVTEMSERYLMRTYRRAPIAFASGQGARLVDLEGKTYLDFVAGIAVTVLGHNHPAVTAAIRGQAARLLHVSNLYQIPQQAELAWWLVDHTGLARAFFCNSGAEANEAAIKLARTWGGIHVASAEYLRGVRRVCTDRDLLLIVDEVQTGIGRTGRLFAYEHFGVLPDILTLAKGLGGGVPIGAMLAGGDAAEVFVPGDHGSTFGGNPLACAAALAVLTTIESDGLVQRAATVGAYLLERLRALAARHSVIVNVRGLGLMVAAELSVEAAPVVDACRARGLLVNAVKPNTLRLVPPLIITPADVDEAVEI